MATTTTTTPSTDKLNQAQKVDIIARTNLLKSNPLLDQALTNSTAQGLPEITITPLQGQYLSIQTQLINAKSVLEIGTLGGYSTIWFASTGAKVTSIEINPHHRDVALENTKSFGDQVEIILGAALDVLPRLEKEGRRFDFVFIDAAWEEQWEYFQWAVKLVRGSGKGGVGSGGNGCIYIDNVVRELIEGEDENEGPREVPTENLVTKVGRLEGVSASLISTVSAHKGASGEVFDGFLLAVVNGV